MADSITIGYTSQTRIISIDGTAGAEFELHIKQGSNYYNWDTDAFTPGSKILGFQKIPANGTFLKEYIIPTVTTDTTYDLYVSALPGTTLRIPTTHEQKIGSLFQKGVKTATFTATESSALVIQNSGSAGTDLTGGTLSNNHAELTQTGTVTEASGYFVYIHSVPSWNKDDGGSWTLSNYVEAKVDQVLSSGNIIILETGKGANIASGYSIVGQNVTDKITVSAISGDKVTLSTAQDLKVGQTLAFSKSDWKIGPLSATVTDTSGTVTFSMTTTHNIEKTGIADITCVLDADDHFSVKPNAFPVTDIVCPALGEVVIYPISDCTNYLNNLGDLDANKATKTYRVHSVPAADVTAKRPINTNEEDGVITYATLGVAGSSDVAAGAVMGDAGVAEVTYSPHSSMIAGDTDFFFYKTVDAQSSGAQTSSLTQGKISITIV